MRILLVLLPPLYLTACAVAPVQKPPPRQSTIEVRKDAAPAKPRWQAVPARADGIAVPGGRRHIVKRGETGIAIARAYGVPWNRIAAANKMDRDAILEIGQALFVPTAVAPARPAPGAPPARPQTPEEQAKAFRIEVDDLITGSATAQPPAARPQPGSTPRSTPGPAPVPRPQPVAAVPPLAWPVDGRVILSRFGPKPGGRVNDGVNIKALRGQAVRAAADGEIIYVGDAIAGFGLMMLVRHAGGVVTAYGHLEDALMDRGQKVQRGQVIARAGSSGEAREPQLLFQLRQGRRALDPMLYLPR